MLKLLVRALALSPFVAPFTMPNASTVEAESPLFAVSNVTTVVDPYGLPICPLPFVPLAENVARVVAAVEVDAVVVNISSQHHSALAESFEKNPSRENRQAYIEELKQAREQLAELVKLEKISEQEYEQRIQAIDERIAQLVDASEHDIAMGLPEGEREKYLEAVKKRREPGAISIRLTAKGEYVKYDSTVVHDPNLKVSLTTINQDNRTFMIFVPENGIYRWQGNSNLFLPTGSMRFAGIHLRSGVDTGSPNDHNRGLKHSFLIIRNDGKIYHLPQELIAFLEIDARWSSVNFESLLHAQNKLAAWREHYSDEAFEAYHYLLNHQLFGFALYRGEYSKVDHAKKQYENAGTIEHGEAYLAMLEKFLGYLESVAGSDQAGPYHKHYQELLEARARIAAEVESIRERSQTVHCYSLTQEGLVFNGTNATRGNVIKFPNGESIRLDIQDADVYNFGHPLAKDANGAGVFLVTPEEGDATLYFLQHDKVFAMPSFLTQKLSVIFELLQKDQYANDSSTFWLDAYKQFHQARIALSTDLHLSKLGGREKKLFAEFFDVMLKDASTQLQRLGVEDPIEALNKGVETPFPTEFLETNHGVHEAGYYQSPIPVDHWVGYALTDEGLLFMGENYRPSIVSNGNSRKLVAVWNDGGTLPREGEPTLASGYERTVTALHRKGSRSQVYAQSVLVTGTLLDFTVFEAVTKAIFEVEKKTVYFADRGQIIALPERVQALLPYDRRIDFNDFSTRNSIERGDDNTIATVQNRILALRLAQDELANLELDDLTRTLSELYLKRELDDNVAMLEKFGHPVPEEASAQNSTSWGAEKAEPSLLGCVMSTFYSYVPSFIGGTTEQPQQAPQMEFKK